MIHMPCADCLAGKPHPQILDLNASLALEGCTVPELVPNPVPVSAENNALSALPERRKSADLLNVVDSATMPPPLHKSSTTT